MYSIYSDYILKLKICGSVPHKHDDSGEMGLHDIRAQFYLDSKKKERDFWEYKLKALAQEMDARVSQAKQQSDQKFAAVESRLGQQADTSNTSIEELKQVMFSMFEEMKKEQNLKLDEISSRLDREKEEVMNYRKLNEKQIVELKSNHEENKQKINHIEKKQEEMKKEIDVANKTTDEKQTKQDKKVDDLNKKIDDFAKESINSTKKLESSILDISQKIENSNKDLKKDFESKIGNTFGWFYQRFTYHFKSLNKYLICHNLRNG